VIPYGDKLSIRTIIALSAVLLAGADKNSSKFQLVRFSLLDKVMIIVILSLFYTNLERRKTK